MTADVQRLLRALPSISALLEHQEVGRWLCGIPRAAVVSALQHTLDASRARILSGAQTQPVEVDALLDGAEARLLELSIPSLRRVINATGIILHTGLGRAPLCDAAIEAIVEGASGYCNLEYELETGGRGKRSTHVAGPVAALTGAESATVVNNNAAATLLLLNTFANGREVVVSRGQLIEIGGSYRLPDVMAASGAVLREVGTTNRTRVTDYERAVTERTAMLLHVHTSNFRVVGFTEAVPVAALAALARRVGCLAVDDLGSGALLPLAALGLPDEPCVQDSVKAGADLVCFSGDKLLGGPQCGMIVGKRELIERLEANPLMRTYRVDKLTLLALEATLRCYQDAGEAVASIPALSMMQASTDALADRARELVDQLHSALPEERFLICSDTTFVGGGAMPEERLATVLVQWRPSMASVDEAAAALRRAETPVIVRVHEDAVCFDLRTVRQADYEALVAAVVSLALDEQAEHPSDGLPLPIL
ncbi:MAG: L-seryl-tRNA(Sec) selenium transferase [Planctomycetes bacterium]|nr:L-seryl-tRNA(Sec) selenium transferase [Planctomycetota bacterium]